jgi:hypothetical protein
MSDAYERAEAKRKREEEKPEAKEKERARNLLKLFKFNKASELMEKEFGSGGIESHSMLLKPLGLSLQPDPLVIGRIRNDAISDGLSLRQLSDNPEQYQLQISIPRFVELCGQKAWNVNHSLLIPKDNLPPTARSRSGAPNR